MFSLFIISFSSLFYFFFFFNDTATTEIYTLSLHDALPISHTRATTHPMKVQPRSKLSAKIAPAFFLFLMRSEEHTSELQSQSNLVCRLLLEKKKKTIKIVHNSLDKRTTYNAVQL